MSVDVCNYQNDTPLCNLYDSAHDISGQAFEVCVHTERNGFKELQFKLPSMMHEDEGESRNYRLDYLISDYRLKVQIKHAELPDGTNPPIETDWFLISESKVTHEAFSENYEIKASHISQLLRTKNLDLEFSDEEGNNTGTIEQIAAVILEGTGWHLGEVYKFYEEDKYLREGETVEKVRSFTSPAKTGAFKMMSNLCELFDAKPIYHGEGQYIEDTPIYHGEDIPAGAEIKTGRTVDIIPMNPFSKDLEEGAVPLEVLQGEGVLELYYDKSIHSLKRTLNTDNLVTKLSAYGSYGDRNGICTLQNASHSELIFNGSLTKNQEYYFVWADARYYFTPSENISSNAKWSSLDFTSRMYVYHNSDIFETYKNPKTLNAVQLTYTEKSVKNYFPYVTDFSYYRKNGLLSDEMLEDVAQFQITIPEKHIAAEKASSDLLKVESELTTTASPGEGFLKFDIHSATLIDGNMALRINKNTYFDGAIYRSDYDESKRNYFTWKVATGIKSNGEALAGKGSVVYVIKQGSPTKWTKNYIKAFSDGTDYFFEDEFGNPYKLHQKDSYASKNAFPVTGSDSYIYVALDTDKMYAWNIDSYNEIHYADYVYGLNRFDIPTYVILWSTTNSYTNDSLVYMFSSNSIAGMFGPREDAVYSNMKAVEESTKVATEVHPLTFITQGDPIPPVPTSEYGWYYKSTLNSYNFGTLYFCWTANGEVGWTNVYVNLNGSIDPETNPSTASTYAYYYHLRRKMLYIRENNAWVPVKGTVDKDKLSANFAVVVNGCINQEILIKGLQEVYTHTFEQGETLPVDNYAFQNEYRKYWLFTTDRTIDPSNGGQLKYYTRDKIVWQDEDEHHIVTSKECASTVLEFPVQNELTGVSFTPSDYDNNSHIFTAGSRYLVSNNIKVYENTQYQYSLPSNSFIVCLDTNSRYINKITSSPFTMPLNTTSVRVVCLNDGSHNITSSHYLRVVNYSNVFFYKGVKYNIISNVGMDESTHVDTRNGIYNLMDQFIALSDEAYITKLQALQNAQNEIKQATIELSDTLGDLYREGYWRETKYVEGDESKLYADAMDNLKEVSHPEATYDFTYLDLYQTEKHNGLSVDENFEDVEWPDVDIRYAAHLVDPDIDTNCWAYIDKVDKYYDMPWKTHIEINTRLSMIGQQSFTDVLAKIAEVANDVKANQAIYKRASVLTGSGKLAAERLEGAINANKIYIFGGTSNWYTDEKGNIVFEDVDGESAMLLSGRGWAISNTKDEYGEWIWRYMASGLGITADAIYTGYLSAERIEAGSITTDKLSASVGQELEISSNKALELFATVDGARPSGALKTTDALIEIKAGDSSTSPVTPAQINVRSGGEINLQAGSGQNKGGVININSNGELNMKGGSTVTLESGGHMAINSNSTLDINTNLFTVNSQNFKILKNNQTNQYDVTVIGNITTTGGTIAGFTIGKSGNIDYMYSGNATSINSTSNGVYIGTNGINIAGGKFKFKSDGTGTHLEVPADSIVIGTNLTLDSKLGSIDSDISNIESDINTIDTTLANRSQMFRDTIANMRTKTYKVGDTFTSTDATGSNHFYYQYVCYHMTPLATRQNYTAAQWKDTYFSNDWQLTGTAVTGGAALAIDANAGTIDLVAANTITIGANSTINIAANKSINLGTSSTGTIVLGAGTKKFTIASYSTRAFLQYGGRAYYNETGSSIASDSVYLGTDGISLGQTSTTNGGTTTYEIPFRVSASGALYAKNATIKGDITATSFTLDANAQKIPYSDISGLTNAGVTYQYKVTTTNEQPSSGWSNTRPSTVDKGKYLWTKIVTTALNGTVSTTYNCEYYPTDGAKGDPGTPGTPGTNGKYITTITELYYLTNSSSAPTINTSTQIYNTDTKNVWTSICPTYATGYTYYRVSKYVYSDNSITFSNVYADYGLSVSNSEAKSAATTVEPFTHDGLSYGDTWGGVTYGVVLSNANNAKPLLIGSNSGITIAKSAADSDGAAIVMNNTGIKLHATSFTVTTTKSTAQTTTNAINLDTTGIQIYSGAKIDIKSGASIEIKSGGTFTVGSSNFNVDSSGNVSMTGTVNATGGNIAGWSIVNYGTNNSIKTMGIPYGNPANHDFSVGISNESNYAFWAGNTTNRANAKFVVSAAGHLKATDAEITGTVVATNITATTNGNIAGWTISSDYLYSGDGAAYVGMGTSGKFAGIWAGFLNANAAPLSLVVKVGKEGDTDPDWQSTSVTTGRLYYSTIAPYDPSTPTDTRKRRTFYRIDLESLYNDYGLGSSEVITNT